MNPGTPLRVLDLFSGIGGFSLGLERATDPYGEPGFVTTGFCENHPYARRVLARHWPGVPIYNDVCAVRADTLPSPIDVVCGGFPCQDISFAGAGAGLAGQRSGLWFEMLRIVDETRPAFVIAENVAALRSRGLEICLGGLAALGYDAEWHCIPAAAVGAPHRRDRVWIIAHPVCEQHEGRGAAVGRASAEVISMADSHRIGRERCEPNLPSSMRRRSTHTGETRAFADTDRAGLAERSRNQQRITLTAVAGSGRWPAEPDVGRVAYGVPNRVDRLGRLGNAVVPQIPELIGRAILNRLALDALA